jgi:uncharacterized protein (TIGR02147 family)
VNNIIALLKTEVADRQRKNPNYSLRAFAKWLGVSPAQLSQVLSGKRPITLAMAKRVSEKLSLSPAEKVDFLASRWPEIIESSAQTSRQLLPDDKFRLISDWFHMAILSLTHLPSAKADPRWIAQQLGISVQQANEALVRLQRLGLVVLKPKFKTVPAALEILSDVPSAAIQKFHKQILNVASEKLETVPLKAREFQSITLAINPSKLPMARKLILEALQKIEQTLETGPAREVYNLSLQLFPLTPISNQESEK